MVELQRSPKLYHKIIQKELQINITEKYLKKDLFLQKKDRDLFIVTIINIMA